MNWDAVSALAEVAGAVATVATLAFLAVQIRANTAAVRASVFNQKTDSWADAMRPLLDASHTELFLSGLRSYRALGAADKLCAAFTVSSTPSGDKLETLLALAVTALQHGMIWVGVDQSPLDREQPNRLGVYVGAAGQADYAVTPPGVQGPDLATGERLGARVAKLALRLRGAH
jgi:hypothetical protein